MSKYSIIETELGAEWDRFVENSPNGTIFSKSEYLLASQTNYKLFYCYNNKEIRAGLLINLNNDSTSVILDDLVIYNGILYNKATNNQNRAQQISEQFKIQEFIFNYLINNYDNIELSLHPSIIDIRALLWVNYGTKLSHFTSSTRYTSYLDIRDFKTSKNLDDISSYKQSSTSRRQEIRYSIKKGYRTEESDNIELLSSFYKKTLNRQDIGVELEKLKRIEILAKNIIKSNTGKMYLCFDQDNNLGSIALFAWDNKRAYYLFGASDPQYRNGHSGTAVLWEAFHDLSKRNIEEVDLEGVNSPHRGWFKLSFGGNILPYYEIKKIHKND